MPLVNTVFPAPWWTPLTYKYGAALSEGLRVSAPLSRGTRVGVTVDAPFDYADTSNIKEIAELIDESAVLPRDLLLLAKWFGDTWFVGAGFAMKSILPAKFFTNEKIAPVKQPENAAGTFKADDCYDARLFVRYEKYIANIEAAEGQSLILFPESSMAQDFWEALPLHLKPDGALWPASASKQWKLWKEAQAGAVKFIVGSPGAAFLPMPALRSIIIDEENQGSWRTQNHPEFNIRSLLGKRAALAGADFTLGGTMPSAKGFIQAEPACAQNKNEGKLVFVDIRDASASEFSAVSDTLPISAPLIRETYAARKASKWAVWILDRKGYAGEVLCDECGSAVRCPRCGGAMRWEKEKLRCAVCGETTSMPEKCPNCGGHLLHGVRPGLEALHERAEQALRHKFGAVMLSQNNGEELPKAGELMLKYPDGALMIGTRRLLAAASGLPVGVIGWIDADSEARGQQYDAASRAFAMVWESMWRGNGSMERRIVIQSRRPGKGWQEALKTGWARFWQRELKERREWELPPFTPLVKINAPRGAAKILAEKIESRGLDCWVSEEDPCEIWVRTKQFANLREILKPFFDIKGIRKGFPKVSLYLD